MSRLRNIPGSRDRIAESSFCVKEPEKYKGRWNEVFGNGRKIHVEIGMGKGRFIMEQAGKNPDLNYIGIEMYSSVLVRAIEKAEEREAKGQDVSNFRFIRMNAEELENVFEKGEIDRIYLNFSDPWPKDRHAKRRLTSDRFLELYYGLMDDGTSIEFKTDNDDLFDFSLGEFKDMGFELTDVTRDLHNSEFDEDNIRTEFEQKFADQGITIKRVVALMK